MAKQTVTILGGTGMLGSIVLDYFAASDEFDLRATVRDKKEAESTIKSYPHVDFRVLDAENTSTDELENTIAGSAWVINAIGVIKPYIHDDNPSEVERATRVNALFPHLLGKAAQNAKARVIQIATDCVYSGEKGHYDETDAHDALDVYGKTKSLGEAYLDGMLHVRCSIIGPELKGHLSLLDWFLGQEQGTTLNGFTNHVWNGVTTLQFARICFGIISKSISFDHIQHVIPGNMITKADLLKCFSKEYDRADLTINPVEAPKVIDRTLSTNNENVNLQIWEAAGYNEPPTVEAMVAELAGYKYPGKKN